MGGMLQPGKDHSCCLSNNVGSFKSGLTLQYKKCQKYKYISFGLLLQKNIWSSLPAKKFLLQQKNRKRVSSPFPRFAFKDNLTVHFLWLPPHILSSSAVYNLTCACVALWALHVLTLSAVLSQGPHWESTIQLAVLPLFPSSGDVEV